MSILRYFGEKGNPFLPNPRRSTVTGVPALAIVSANREVEKELSKTKHLEKRGKYNKYTDEERATIARYAMQNGVKSAIRKFSKPSGYKLHDSTVRGFIKVYRSEVKRMKRQLELPGASQVAVTALPLKKQGRPLLLGRFDGLLQEYIKKIRDHGAPITTAVVIASARGLLLSMDKSRLQQFGGPATLSIPWARSLLKRMKYTRRKATTKATQFDPSVFKAVKEQFLQEIVDVTNMEQIPGDLVLNWDQTGLNLIPAPAWTMEKRGTKRVRIKGVDDKRQITGVFCGSLFGEFLPIQLIYGGRTNRCHPPFAFPSDWHITHSHNHWANETTMLAYIEHVIIPFVEKVRTDIGKENQAALVLFDHFKGQLTENITNVLEDNNIHSILVPASCTDKLQPLDLTVNRSAKAFLKKQFEGWYAEELQQKIDASNGTLEDIEPVDMSTARMKCIGASWLVKLCDYFAANPSVIVNGFLASHITQSIDCGKPVLEDLDKDDSDDDKEDDGTDDGDDDGTDDGDDDTDDADNGTDDDEEKNGTDDEEENKMDEEENGTDEDEENGTDEDEENGTDEREENGTDEEEEEENGTDDEKENGTDEDYGTDEGNGMDYDNEDSYLTIKMAAVNQPKMHVPR